MSMNRINTSSLRYYNHDRLHLGIELRTPIEGGAKVFY